MQRFFYLNIKYIFFNYIVAMVSYLSFIILFNPRKRVLTIEWWFVLIIFIATSTCHSEEITEYYGRVIKVVDGDTIHILIDNKNIKIRLAEIDTPEKGQPYWRVSRKALEDMVAGKYVTIIKVTIDRYGRVIGQVYVDKAWVNENLVKDGYAWVYRKYARSDKIYAAEEYARQNNLGIWNLPESELIPPWEWRRGAR